LHGGEKGKGKEYPDKQIGDYLYPKLSPRKKLKRSGIVGKPKL